MKYKQHGIIRTVLSVMIIAAWLVLPVGYTPAKAAPGEWSVPVTADASTNGQNNLLVFGTNLTATSGFDWGLDWDHLPVPPGSTFNAYFQTGNELNPALDEDYRPLAESIQWTLYTFSTTQPITVSWNAGSIPANFSLILTETGLNVDMKATSSTVLAAGVHTLTITASVAPMAVTTVSSTGVSYYEATLNGNLDSLGINDSALVSFVWGETLGGPYAHETGTISKSATGAFSVNLSGLSPNTPYYFKAKAAGSTTVYGTELSFTTLATVSPAVTTLSATRVGATAATLNGILDSRGTATTANVSFVWGETMGGPYLNETTPESITLPGPYSFRLITLTGSTTFYYKAKVVGHGTDYGDEMSFTTLTSGCFIATAAYGSYVDPHLDTLRSFRDRFLITNDLGQDFVDFYYTNSPPVAQYITEHPWLKPLVRAALMPAVAMSAVALKITLAAEIAIFCFLVAAAVVLTVWMRKRRRQKTA